MNKLALLLVAAMFAPFASGGNDMLPDRSVLDEGRSWNRNSDYTITRVLNRVYGRDVLARAVVIETGVPEWGVGISRAGEEYRLVGAFSPAPLSTYAEYLDSLMNATDDGGDPVVSDLSKLPPDPLQVMAETCNVPVSSVIGVRLVEVWKVMLRNAMLSQIELEKPAAPSDRWPDIRDRGRTHYFSVDDSLPFVGARVTGWYKGGDTENLVELTDTLAQYCRAPASNLEQRISDQSAALANRLNIP
jgi:hypothetical protein